MLKSLPVVLFLALVAGLPACGDSSSSDPAAAAEASLQGGRHAEAETAATAALATPAVQADKALAWRLERVRLDAIGAQGRLPDVLSGLTRLARDYPAQVDHQFYGRLGSVVLQAGHTSEAIEVAEAGKAAFPESATAFDGLIEQIKERASESGDKDALDRLAQLGYLGG